MSHDLDKSSFNDFSSDSRLGEIDLTWLKTEETDLHDEVIWWQNVFRKSTPQSTEQMRTSPLVRMHPLFHEPFWKNLKKKKCIIFFFSFELESSSTYHF